MKVAPDAGVPFRHSNGTNVHPRLPSCASSCPTVAVAFTSKITVKVRRLIPVESDYKHNVTGAVLATLKGDNSKRTSGNTRLASGVDPFPIPSAFYTKFGHDAYQGAKAWHP